MRNTDAKKRIRNTVLIQLSALICIVSLYFAFKNNIISFPCIFRRLTGLNCPGCGITRAVLACAQLDFKAAFHYNLLFPLELGYIAWAWLSSSVNYYRSGVFSYRSPSLWLDISVLAAVLIWGIIRNIIGI